TTTSTAAPDTTHGRETPPMTRRSRSTGSRAAGRWGPWILPSQNEQSERFRRPLLPGLADLQRADRRGGSRPFGPGASGASRIRPMADLGHRRPHRRGTGVLALRGVPGARGRDDAVFGSHERDRVGGRPRYASNGRRADGGAGNHLADRGRLPRAVEARHALRAVRAPGRQQDPGPHAPVSPATSAEPRRLPFGRAVADARHPRPAADRPLARGLTVWGRARADCP